ncbi:hypothetical protein BSLG_004513 [Batrachochytrium salamandrivorans]|nr:hypothetical protein BSLG_004513 [Batrachochytrium salamandrivorans]
MLAAGSLSQDTGASGKLFKRRTNRAKKGIHALVLTSGAISTVAFPSFFSFLPFQAVNISKIPTRQDGFNAAARGGVKDTGKSHSSTNTIPLRRVASLSVLAPSSLLAPSSIGMMPTSATAPMSRSAIITRTPKEIEADDEEEDFEAFEAECDKLVQVIDGMHGGFVAPAAEELEAVLHGSFPLIQGTHHLPLLPTQTDFSECLDTNSNPTVEEKNMARRVQSTPGMLSVGTLDPTRATPAHYGHPHPSAMMSKKESISKISTSFFHASVQARAKARLNRDHRCDVPIDSAHVSPPPLFESWDDDFSTPDDGDDDTSDVNQSWGMGGLIVPKRVDRHQSRLQRDRFSIRDFALHIQDLRLIFQEVTKTMNRTSQKTSGDYVEHSPSVLRVIETAQVLLDVAEHADEPTADLFDLESSPSPTDSEFPTKDSARKITPRHIKVLIDLIVKGVPAYTNGPDTELNDSDVPDAPLGVDERAALECVNKLVRDQVLVFESSLLGVLNSRMVPLKICLRSYAGVSGELGAPMGNCMNLPLSACSS